MAFLRCLLCSADSLQWCSAQVHCQQVLNPARVRAMSNRQQQSTVASTSFQPMSGWLILKCDPRKYYTSTGETGAAVYSSKPAVLFCELHLEAGEERSCELRAMGVELFDEFVAKFLCFYEGFVEGVCCACARRMSVVYCARVGIELS